MAFGKKKTSRSKFEYHERDQEAYAARANVGGLREGFLIEGVKMFSPKAGSHSVRILPPTWKKPEHYGLDVYVHYDIGPDGGAYLCLDKMGKGDCAICEERKRAIAEGEEELADGLRWTRRVLCWVIDRNSEKDGPLLWSMPQSLDKDIASVCQDKKTGEVYSPDKPDQGYDVSFEREGERMKTKYVGVQLDRKPSPLSDDDELMAEWLEFIAENPVPDELVFQEADYIESLVSGGMAKAGAARRAKADEGRGRPKFGKKGKDEDDEEKERPRKGKGKPKKGSDLEWEDVHALDEKELRALAEEHEVDIDEAEDEDEAADLICEALEIEEPPKKAKSKSKSKDDDDDDSDDDDDEDDKKKKKQPSRLEQMRNRRKGK